MWHQRPWRVQYKVYCGYQESFSVKMGKTEACIHIILYSKVLVCFHHRLFDPPTENIHWKNIFKSIDESWPLCWTYRSQLRTIYQRWYVGIKKIWIWSESIVGIQNDIYVYIINQNFETSSSEVKYNQIKIFLLQRFMHLVPKGRFTDRDLHSRNKSHHVLYFHISEEIKVEPLVYKSLNWVQLHIIWNLYILKFHIRIGQPMYLSGVQKNGNVMPIFLQEVCHL